MNSFSEWGKKYLLLCGLVANALLIALLIFKPSILWDARHIVLPKLVHVVNQSAPAVADTATIQAELNANFPPWTPVQLPAANPEAQIVFSHQFPSLQAAANTLRDGDVFKISAGVYQQAMVIKANNVVIEGDGHVVLDGTAAGNKAAIVNKGDFNEVRNLECRNIRVKAGNGACVRHEGKHLKLTHVYFHDSQEGILTGNTPGLVEIEDSRFENLGYRGQAHGVYTNGGQLRISNSLMLSAKSEGHEVKSRSEVTIIEDSTIASLSSRDSRLIDISNGGELVVARSVLQKGPNSSNQDAIGYGLEGMKHADNSITLTENIFLLERDSGSVLLHHRSSPESITTEKNVIIAERDPGLVGMNLYFSSREQAGLKPFPALPKVLE